MIFLLTLFQNREQQQNLAIAFRVFKELLIKKYGKEEANKRIYATTDKARGAVKEEADVEGWQTFVIP